MEGDEPLSYLLWLLGLVWVFTAWDWLRGKVKS